MVSYGRLFEGVCLTHVILTPGACGGGVRAAVPDTTSGESAGEFREARFCAQARYLRHICSESDPHFGRIFSKFQKTPQRDPTGAPRRPKGLQRTAKGNPRAPQRVPKGAKGSPKSAQRLPKAARRRPREAPKGANGSHREPKEAPEAATGPTI